MRRKTGPSLVQIKAYRLDDEKPLSETIMEYCWMVFAPPRRQSTTILLLIGRLGTYFIQILSIEIHIFSFKKIHSKMSSGKWRSSCLGLNVSIYGQFSPIYIHNRYGQSSTDMTRKVVCAMRSKLDLYQRWFWARTQPTRDVVTK